MKAGKYSIGQACDLLGVKPHVIRYWEEEIPFLARLFQITDVYDALTNDRCYRRAYSCDEATDIISAEVDRGWWDRRVVDEFLDLITARGALEDQGIVFS